MGRRKTTKEYAIRLTHPDFGEFYFNYFNNDSYNFTQNLSKVTTWKTLSAVKSLISYIEQSVENRQHRIVLPFGKDVNNIEERFRSKMTCSMKRYYFPINSIKSKNEIQRAKDNIEKLNKTLLPDSEYITNMIKHSKQLEKHFMGFVEKLRNDLNLYRKDHSFLEKNKNSEEIFLDIVDASYSFRLLKLRNLKAIQTEEV